MVWLKLEAFLLTIVHVLRVARYSDYKTTTQKNKKLQTKNIQHKNPMSIITITTIKQYYYNIVYNSMVKTMTLSYIIILLYESNTILL